MVAIGLKCIVHPVPHIARCNHRMVLLPKGGSQSKKRKAADSEMTTGWGSSGWASSGGSGKWKDWNNNEGNEEKRDDSWKSKHQKWHEPQNKGKGKNKGKSSGKSYMESPYPQHKAKGGGKSIFKNLNAEQCAKMGYEGPPQGVPMPIGWEKWAEVSYTPEGRPFIVCSRIDCKGNLKTGTESWTYMDEAYKHPRC